MNYESLKDLELAFTKGKISELPNKLSVAGVDYILLKSSNYPLSEMLEKDLRGIVLYSVSKNTENIERYKRMHKSADDVKGLQDRLAFIWAFNNMRLHPVATRFTTSARSEPLIGAGTLHEANIENDRIIGNTMPVILSGFNGNDPIDAKVDTGAAISSLHATQIEQKGHGMVSFVFGDRRFTMPSLETASVQTAGHGIENRPVVVFDVIIPNNSVDKNNRVIKKIKFNLNGRGEMPHKILLGQNFIKAGDFVVADEEEVAKMQENYVNWDHLQEQFKEFVYVSSSKSNDEIVNLIKKILVDQ